MNQFDANAQYRSCQKLLSAVVALAVHDCQLKPISRGRVRADKEPSDISLSALRFLFTSDSDGYLTALDIDPKQFKKRLVDNMFDLKKDTGNSCDESRRSFRYNYQYFCRYYSNINFDLIDLEKQDK